MGKLSDKIRNKLSRRHPKGDDAAKQGSRKTSPRPGEASSSSVAVVKKREKYGLFPLYPIPASAIFEVDVVAVHGLGGDWEEAWTDDTTGKLWLRDFLPSQFPKTRVWSFGYNASVLSKSVEDIDDAATSLVDALKGERQSTPSRTKPIIFVAHSLGGIIVKRALILANERSDHWKDIQDSTIAAIFFGVPHRGADKAYWADFATNVLSFTSLGLAGNRSFVEALKRNSPEFSKISNAFIQPASKMKIIRTFYETEKIGNNVIVDKDSASLRTNNELAVPIQGADHRDICRFESDESQKYRVVRNALEMVITRATEVDSATVMKQVDEHVRRARTDWQQRIPEKPRQTEDFLWAINMPQTRSWKAARGYSLLRVEYNSPWDWQAALSVAFHQQLQSEALEVIWGLAPTDVQELQGGAWKTLLPRILLAQLLSLHPECIPLMDNAILSLRADDTFHVEDNRERLDASWKNSFCSANSPWQHQWIILSCALQCLHEGIALMLVGFNDELYQTLDEGLRYLDHKHYANPSKSDPGNFFSTRCKALIVGTPRSEAFRRDKQFDTLASLSSRIDEDVEREVCLSSLHFPELHARRDRVEKSEKGTTQWIWKHPAYANWCGQDSSLLWIHGKPGSGKSTLAAALQRSLSKDIQGLLLADFFYSSRGGPTETGHCWMLRSILYQLLQRQATLYPFYKLAFRKFQASEFGSWKYELLEEMLLSLQNPTGDDDVNRTFLLILDGLDESEDGDSARTSRQRSLQLFSRLSCSERKIVFKVIALSRPEPLIKHALRPTYSIDMKDENKADIERIARYGISRLWRHLYFGSDDSETKPTSTALSPDGPSTYNAASIEMEDVEDIPQLDFVRDYLLKHADGVILWVVMVLREIGSIAKSGACTMAQLEAELSKIPTSLGELYQDIFDRLKSSPYSSPDQASYVFSWLLFTQETLKVCEIRDAMAMFYWNDSSDDKRGEFLKTHRVLQYGGRWDPTWTLLTNLCGGFVEIVPQERSAAGTLWVDRTIDPDDSVQLIHRTARDFLIFDSGSAFLNLSSSRCLDSLCTTCVNYLELAFTVVLDTEIEIAWKSFILHLEDRPLLRYILGNLPSMLEQNCKSNAATISLYRRISQYIADAWWSRRSSVTWWFLKQWSRRHFILDSDGKLQIKFPDNFDVSIFVDLDEENDEVTTTGTAPAKSSECYQSSFVRNLKARASQCEAWNAVLSDFIPNSLLSDGLVYASKFGCPGALRVLLAAGAEKNGLLENPLCKAAMSGHHAIVRILLEEGAAHGINSMKSAVLGGNVLLVKELLLSSHFVSKTSRQDRSDIRALAGSLGESKAEIKALLEEYLTSHPDDSELSSPRLDTDDEMIQGSLINAPELSDISGSVSTPTTISDQSFEDVDRDASASGTMFRVWKRVSFAVP